MEIPNRDETLLRTFNTAKKYAEDILFPMMELYQKFQRQSDFGSDDLSLAVYIPEEIRDIERYNGLKAMNDILHNLLITISSTVRIKGNKDEVAKLLEIIEITKKTKFIFYNHKELFFKTIHKDRNTIEALDRDYFEKIKDIINVCYINNEVLMTKNKLLFADSGDEFQTDKELIAKIKEEYINN